MLYHALVVGPPSHDELIPLASPQNRVVPHPRYRLQGNMRRGTASSLAGTWSPYATLEKAREAAREMLKDDGTVREYNVVRCKYAEFFRELGEPELGGILLCDSDFHIADIGGAEVEFKRTQTIMQGAPYCDFRYRFK